MEDIFIAKARSLRMVESEKNSESDVIVVQKL